jgi:hypothetical protein
MSTGKPWSSFRVKRTVIGPSVDVLTPPGATATTMPVEGAPFAGAVRHVAGRRGVDLLAVEDAVVVRVEAGVDARAAGRAVDAGRLVAGLDQRGRVGAVAHVGGAAVLDLGGIEDAVVVGIDADLDLHATGGAVDTRRLVAGLRQRARARRARRAGGARGSGISRRARVTRAGDPSATQERE